MPQASGVPPTTALRWIGQLTKAGLFARIEDDSDRPRAFIALTDRAPDAMARYFVELGTGASRMVKVLSHRGGHGTGLPAR